MFNTTPKQPEYVINIAQYQPRPQIIIQGKPSTWDYFIKFLVELF